MDWKRPPATPAGGVGGDDEEVGLRYVPSPHAGPATPYLASLQAQLPRSNYDTPSAIRSPAPRIERMTGLHTGPRAGQPAGMGGTVATQRTASSSDRPPLLQLGSDAYSDSSDDGDAPLYGERIPLERPIDRGTPSVAAVSRQERPPLSGLGSATPGQRRIAGAGGGGAASGVGRRSSASDGSALAAAQQDMAAEMARMLAAAGLPPGGAGTGAGSGTPGLTSGANKHSALQTPLQLWEAPPSPQRRGLRLDLGGSDDDEPGPPARRPSGTAGLQLRVQDDAREGTATEARGRPSLLLSEQNGSRDEDDDVGLLRLPAGGGGLSSGGAAPKSKASDPQRPSLGGFDQSLSSSTRGHELPERPQLLFRGGFGETLDSTGGHQRGGGGRPGLAIGFGNGDSEDDDDDDDEDMYGARIEDHDLQSRPQVGIGGRGIAASAAAGRGGDSLEGGGPEWGVSTSGTLNLAGIVAIKESGIKAWANALQKGTPGHEGAARPGSGHGGGAAAQGPSNRRPSVDPTGGAASAAADASAEAASERSKNIKDELVTLDVVGRGASSTVDRALHIPTLQLVAVKNVSLFDEGVRAQMARELKVLYANLTPLVPVVVGPRGGLEEVSDATLSASALQAGLEASAAAAPAAAGALASSFSGLKLSPTREDHSDDDDDEASADAFAASTMSLSALLDPMAAPPPPTPADGTMPDLAMTLSGAAARPLLARSLSAPGDLSAVVEAQVAAVSGGQVQAEEDGSGVAMVVAATCPYVLRLYDAFTNSKRAGVSIVLEYCGGGSLQDVLDAGGCRSEPALARMAAHLLRGLAFLHARCLLHRDIKPANVLMTRLGDAFKVADLGVSRVLKASTELSDDAGEGSAALARTWAGTMVYMAPERLDTSVGGGYGLPSDIWSAGLTLLAVACGRFPYPDSSAGMYWDMVNTVKNGPVPLHVLDEVGAATGCTFSPEFRDFLRQALTKDPAHRPTAEALLCHPWLRGHWAAAAGSKRRGPLPEPGPPGSATDPLSCQVGCSLADAARDASAHPAAAASLPAQLCREYGPFSARTSEQQEAALATLHRLVAELTGLETSGAKPAAQDKERGWREFLTYFRRLRAAPAGSKQGSNKAGESDSDIPSFLPGKPVDSSVLRASTDSQLALVPGSPLSSSTSSGEGTWGSERGRDYLARSLDETAFNDFLAGRMQRAAVGLTASLRAPIALGATLTSDTLRTTLSVRRAVSSTPPPALGLTGTGTGTLLGSTLSAAAGATLARLASTASASPPTYDELALEPRDIEGLAAQLGLPPLLVLAVVNDGIKAKLAADAKGRTAAAASAPGTTTTAGTGAKPFVSPQKPAPAAPQSIAAAPVPASIVGLAVQSPASVPRIRVPASVDEDDHTAEGKRVALGVGGVGGIVTSPMFSLPSDRKYAPGVTHPRSASTSGGSGGAPNEMAFSAPPRAGTVTDTPRAGVPFSTVSGSGKGGVSAAATGTPAAPAPAPGAGGGARARGWWSPSPHGTSTPHEGQERSGSGGDTRSVSPSRGGTGSDAVTGLDEPASTLLKTPHSSQARLFVARRRDSRTGDGASAAVPPRPSSGAASRPDSASDLAERSVVTGLRRPSLPLSTVPAALAEVSTPSFFSASGSPASPDSVHRHHYHSRPQVEPGVNPGAAGSGSTPQSSASSSLSSPYYVTAMGARRRSSLTGLVEAPRSVARPPSGGGLSISTAAAAAAGGHSGGGGFHGLFHPDSPADAYPSLVPGRPGLLVGASPGTSGLASYIPGDWTGISAAGGGSHSASRPGSHAGVSRGSSAGSQRRPPSRLEPLATSSSPSATAASPLNTSDHGGGPGGTPSHANALGSGSTPRRLPALGTPSSGGGSSSSSPIVSASTPVEHTPVSAASVSAGNSGVTLVRLRSAGGSSTASGATPLGPSAGAGPGGLHINAPKFEPPAAPSEGADGTPGSASASARRYTPIRRRL